MWIVEWALRRALSIAVMALLMLVLGILSFAMMNIDIFPAINLPVVKVIYNHPGLSAIDMERRIVLLTERADSTTVNGIEHIESESIEGLGLEKIYFYPGSDMGSAIAQLTATSGTVETVLPRGTEPLDAECSRRCAGFFTSTLVTTISAT
jgi:multidrug efflux pump subunit AcrB